MILMAQSCIADLLGPVARMRGAKCACEKCAAEDPEDHDSTRPLDFKKAAAGDDSEGASGE